MRGAQIEGEVMRAFELLCQHIGFVKGEIGMIALVEQGGYGYRRFSEVTCDFPKLGGLGL